MGESEASIVEGFEGFIARCALRYARGRNDVIADLKQTGRVAAIRALRSWREASGAARHTHVMRNVWWAMHRFGIELKREIVASTGGDGIDHVVDESASNPEAALAAIELLRSMSPEEREAVLEVVEGKVGRPTKHFENARIRAAAYEKRRVIQ